MIDRDFLRKVNMLMDSSYSLGDTTFYFVGPLNK
jgi:hypothetical protein